MPDDPYAILEVDRAATDAEIKAAYRRLAAMYHPDRNPGFQDAANEKLKALNDAYERVKRAGRGEPADADPVSDGASQPNAEQDGQSGHGEGSSEARATDHPTAIADALVSAGCLSDAEPDHPVVELIVSIISAGARIDVCAPTTAVPSGQYGFRELRRSFLRSAPRVGFSGMASTPALAAVALERTEMVLCTTDALVWTTSRVGDTDGVVVQEYVTACSLPFANIVGSCVANRRKGMVEVWVADGPTLTFRTAPQEAETLAAYVDSAAASQ